MKRIVKILEHKDVVKYLMMRNLLAKYRKQKDLILQGEMKTVDFKKRKPFAKNTWYFRIDKQYRAHCFFEGENILKVFRVDDHQK